LVSNNLGKVAMFDLFHLKNVGFKGFQVVSQCLIGGGKLLVIIEVVRFRLKC
jgi:hypothetical protein